LKKNSVTIIANGFQPHYIIDLVNGLAQNGVRVDFLGSDIYDSLKLDSTVNFQNIRGSHNENAPKIEKIRRILQYYWKLLIYTLKTKNEVFHIQWLRFNLFEGVILNIIFKFFRKKIIYTAHNVLPHMENNLINRLIFFLIYNIADVIIVHTEFIKKRIVNEFKVRKNKIKVVKHGVYKIVDTPLLTKQKAREKLELKTDDKVILFFGNIKRYKGLDILISAFSIYRKNLNNLKLIIAGRVNNEDYKYEIEHFLSHSELKESVITKFRYIAEEEVEILFKAIDVVVLPYLEGSQSGVLFLSYAYGKPVIASNIGAFPDDIVVGKTGYIFKVGNSKDLANKIKLYFNNFRSKTIKLENSIKQYANSKYSWQKTGEDLKRVYLTISN